MKKLIALFACGVVVAMVSAASADEKVTDRKDKPACLWHCDTCYRCVESGDRPTDPCKRTETYECNCRCD